MSWFKKKQVVEQVAPTTSAQPAKPELSVFDYPKSQYKVYWETFLDQVADGSWTAEVRFIGYDTPQRSVDNIYGPTKENVEQNVAKLVKDKMASYRK